MKVYRGIGGTHEVRIYEVPNDNDKPMELLGPLPLVRPKHSPTGFSWGYEGSGPAELARQLLIDHLGDEARCSTCAGRGRVVYLELDPDDEDKVLTRPAEELEEELAETGSCPACWGEGWSFPPVLYQALKRELVATWPGEGSWSLTAHELDSWLGLHGAVLAS